MTTTKDQLLIRLDYYLYVVAGMYLFVCFFCAVLIVWQVCEKQCCANKKTENKKCKTIAHANV